MWQKLKYCYLVTLLLMMNQYICAADNLYFHGTLVAHPCVIPPGEETILVNFKGMTDKELYANGRTNSEKLTIHLSKCDLALGNTVQVAFEGSESLALPGLLALDGSSQASGIAIGIETEGGKPILLNKVSDNRFPLVSGDSYIHMQTYVKAEPKAIIDKTISNGPFRASMTFALTYD